MLCKVKLFAIDKLSILVYLTHLENFSVLSNFSSDSSPIFHLNERNLRILMRADRYLKGI
jgi:hypothetical protein